MDCSGVAPPPITDSPGITSARRPGRRATERQRAFADLLRASGAAWRARARRPSAPAACSAAYSPSSLVDHLVQAQGAEQGIAAQARDQLRAAGENSGLRSAEQFVAAEGHQIHAGGEAVGDQRLLDAEGAQVDHAAAAQVFVHGDAAFAPERREFAQFGARGEARDAEIAGMHAHQQARAVVDGVAVIVDAGAIGGADFAQDGAGAGHDVGDAEAVADFDQFAARDDGLAAGRKFVEGEEDGGGVVVDRDAGRAHQAFQQAAVCDVALAAASGREVVFQIGVAGDNRQRRRAARGPGWCAARRRWR